MHRLDLSLVEISRELARRVEKLRFAPPVAYVYNPLEYAWAAHAAYLERWGHGRKEVVLLGMNPGPFGMAQTGVPFGDVTLVRDFIGVSAEVGRPKREHPSRPVLGFECPRSEVSGTRLWSFARSTFGTPEAFFERFFVVNYCPLAFMESSGKNRTPDKLPKDEQARLFAPCDDALRRIVSELAPAYVVGVGAFAKSRAEQALTKSGVRIATILHPSPASPRANRGWDRIVREELREIGVLLPGASPKPSS